MHTKITNATLDFTATAEYKRYSYKQHRERNKDLIVRFSHCYKQPPEQMRHPTNYLHYPQVRNVRRSAAIAKFCAQKKFREKKYALSLALGMISAALVAYSFGRISLAINSVSYTHLTLPTTPYV